MSPSQINTHLCLNAHMTSDVTASDEENTCCRYRCNMPAEWPHRDVITHDVEDEGTRLGLLGCTWLDDWFNGFNLIGSTSFCLYNLMMSLTWSPCHMICVCEKQKVSHLSCFSNSARKGRLCFYFGRFCWKCLQSAFGCETLGHMTWPTPLPSLRLV